MALHYVDRRRTIAALLLAVAGLLLFLAVSGAWWQVELIASNPLTNAQVQHVLVTYGLGGSVNCSTWRWPPSNPCNNITAGMGSPQRAAYQVANYAVGALAVGAWIAAGMLLLGVYGVNFGRPELRLLLAWGLALALVGTATIVGTVVLGPGSDAGTYCSELSGNVTTCPIYYGSTNAGIIPGGCQSCDLLLSWGGGPSFYLAVVATGMMALAWWLLYVGRKGPFSRDEQAAWAVTNRPLSLTGPGPGRPNMRYDVPVPPPASPYVAPPSSSAASPRFKLRTDPWTCPRCGRVNSAWAGMCLGCQGPPPSD